MMYIDTQLFGIGTVSSKARESPVELPRPQFSTRVCVQHLNRMGRHYDAAGNVAPIVRSHESAAVRGEDAMVAFVCNSADAHALLRWQTPEDDLTVCGILGKIPECDHA